MASRHEDVDVEKGLLAPPCEMDEDDGESPRAEDVHDRTGISYTRSIVIVVILFYINLLSYMDRLSVTGALPYLEKSFHLKDSGSGLLQAVFLCSFMLVAPVFGYLGDHWNRKYLLCIGITLWSASILGSSFIPDKYFWLFLLMRGLVGIGAASYSTIAPSIIADLFVADQRSRMLSIFWTAIPVGCGLGYIMGAKVTSALGGDWHWALRIIPGLGIIAVLLLIFFMKEPSRGAAEQKSYKHPNNNSWTTDVKALLKNPSFMLSMLGFTTVTFVSGSLSHWALSFYKRARVILYRSDPCQTAICQSDDSLIFGMITVITGIVGVGAGVEISKRFRKINPRADALVCACGMLGGAPFLLLALLLASFSLVASYIFISIGALLLALNFAIVDDILLSVMTPRRRSTAEALQIIVSHLLGDAWSPSLIGVLSDLIRRGKPESDLLMFNSLKYALMVCVFVSAIGGGLFLASALFLEKDRKRADMESEDGRKIVNFIVFHQDYDSIDCSTIIKDKTTGVELEFLKT
ncbi:protein spinster homolog 1-like [Rhinoderma darwinii]|uniref:protein spinster homolog 1-like n=1 Tax=Rhinoderma darwinii TaxID=43563 RepID=UPI003F6737C6